MSALRDLKRSEYHALRRFVRRAFLVDPYSERQLRDREQDRRVKESAVRHCAPDVQVTLLRPMEARESLRTAQVRNIRRRVTELLAERKRAMRSPSARVVVPALTREVNRVLEVFGTSRGSQA